MLAIERKSEILTILQKEKSVLVAELSREVWCHRRNYKT